jgi:hypothetical protein
MLQAILKGEVKILRDLLKINYLLWPEDAPLKLSPRLFVAAARQGENDLL